MQREGYLFFPKLIDPSRALAVKNDILSLLREHHIIEDDGSPEPTWSGGPVPTETEYMVVYDKIVRLESFQQLAESSEIVNVVEALCEEPVRAWQQRLIRLVYPVPDASTSIPFQTRQQPRVSGPIRTAIRNWVIERTLSIPAG